MGRATLTLTNLCNNNCNNVTLINFIQIFNVNNWYSDLIVLDFIGILLSETMAGIWPTLCICTQVKNKGRYTYKGHIVASRNELYLIHQYFFYIKNFVHWDAGMGGGGWGAGLRKVFIKSSLKFYIWCF